MFVFILTEVLLPLLILIFVGFLLQRKFVFNLKHFSTLITYCLMPVAVFANIYDITIQMDLLLKVLYYIVAYSLVMILIGNLFAKVLNLQKGESAALKNSISLMNSGNYGLPVSQLIFSQNPIGVAVQIFVLIFQNLLTYSYGMYNLLSTTKSLKDIFISFLKLPVFHALILGIIFQVGHIKLSQVFLIPIHQISDSFAPIALILLGAQLAHIKLKLLHRAIMGSLIGRLIIGPLIALSLIYLFHIDGAIAQSLFIASAFPTSRNTSTIAFEYDVEPELHAQIVLFSTLLSSVTVSIVIYLSYILFT
ncbi:AEC family transporter [Mammaliicoccus sciuri]|uniref:AEC family transporter n=1 Tax=Mammaliicoccus sciuri TaxID=1296 RepID=UPI000D1F425D|nr:AEC family transporter [Mammaliicoccus sciuri]PTJ44215.1 transporter [Mammaliicoccus sciuri]PTJ62280.1 transporter [Mammaliicoccus sciuri]RIN88369.1 AEC family transporter [Mammaliicoccus sciuri]RIO01730.1 AEC family transporter [Mammaliicoccus sciuri]RIO15422.1 AEC family transporter [Mammaliicoccus sciuri]